MSTSEVVLSEAQSRAVAWEGGPLLVLAGPGAGKTEVLAERAVRIIQATPKRRFRVLGMTFTNFAASEMKQRVAIRLGRDSDRVRIATFHSLCAGVLRQHGSHLGLRPDFRILTLNADRAVVLADALGPSAPWGSQPPPAERIARNLDALFRADPAARSAFAPGPGAASGWKRELLDEYVARLIQKNCMDYGSLLWCCFRLIDSEPRIAADFPIAYPHVLVDEYQDTNAIQDRLLRTLWPPGSSELFIVADDDQMIFQWNGASPERIADLQTDYRMAVLHLPESFRCPPAVVERANRLMEAGPNETAEKPPIVAAGHRSETESVRLRCFPTEAEEVSWVSRDLRDRQIASGEIAVLARNGRLVEAAYEALRTAGVPAWRRRPRDEFVSPGIRFLLAALRLANTPGDGAQLRLLVKAFSELGGVEVSPASAESRADVENGALLAAFVAKAAEESNAAPAKALIAAAREHLVLCPDHRRFSRQALEIMASDIARATDPAERTEANEESDVWRQIAAKIHRQGGDSMRLEQFLHELDLRPIVPEPKREEVQCLTIHQAKGKTFEHVYLLGLAEDQLPSYFAKANGEADPRIEEERRVCFVGMTRASETLTLTRARSYYGRPKKPSRFLADMGLRPEKHSD